MPFRLRKFVFWILVLVLPLQSFAAVTGGACACAKLFSMTEKLGGVSDHMVHLDAANADLAMVMASANEAEEGACHTPETPEKQHCDSESGDASEKTSCSACSGCCVMHAAIPVVVFAPDHVPAPKVSAISIPDLFTEHIALTPKRPPRSHSA